MRKNGSLSVSMLSRASLIAAIYVCLTYIWPFSFGPVQVRISEAMTILPVFTPAAIPGLFIGCIVSGLLSGAVWFDVVFGSLATLLAAILTRKLRKNAYLALIPPVLFNCVIVGCVVHFAYVADPSLSALPFTMFTVGAGEAIACYALGVPLFYLMKRMPDTLWK